MIDSKKTQFRSNYDVFKIIIKGNELNFEVSSVSLILQNFFFRFLHERVINEE